MGSGVSANGKLGTPITRFAVTSTRSTSSFTIVACSVTVARPAPSIATRYDGIQRRPFCR
jgi:hypothetical protein